MEGLITPFYEESKIKGRTVARGDIFEDQPLYLPTGWGLRLTRVDPTRDELLDFELTGRTEDIFQHPPIRKPPIGNGEALVVARSKWNRPVIVLAAEAFDLLAGPDTAQLAGSYVCVPIYGSDQFSERLRRRIRAYEFPNAFYLPPSKTPPFDEGFVRFDHIQAIRQDHLRSRSPLRLSADAGRAMDEWLYYFLTGRLQKDSLIALYREEQLKAL